MKQTILSVVIDAPLDFPLDYRWDLPGEDEPPPQIGQLALVPFGRREVMGVIVDVANETPIAAEKLKNAIAIRTKIGPLDAAWLDLCRFAGEYYQRPLGEVAVPGIPKNLRSVSTISIDRALKRLAKKPLANDTTPASSPNLNTAQQTAVDAIGMARGYSPLLLYGVTGSGKTEVYLQSAARILADSGGTGNPAQILILVPEINLTPQLEENVRARFPGVTVATLHSGLAEGERLSHWLSAHGGQAHIVLGTRLAVLASMPNLRLIIIDEEHDPSYKQQEGLRYSARDLAVWRAHQLSIPIVLGSATPSLETWQHAQSGRYRTLALPSRAVPDAVLPTVSLIDLTQEKSNTGLSSLLVKAIKERLDKSEQTLLFLNRRGYAPVMACDACAWVSNCPRCTAFMVLHKLDGRMRCHHCSLEQTVPRFCPTCGNVDIQPLGRGTQRVEESLQACFPTARILRIDADSTRHKGSAQAAFDRVHNGEVDILIGTQMVAKGHDFQNLTLVGILNPDTALFSHDYRAGERLFSQLMQVAGRAGRTARKNGGGRSEVLIQTRHPHHPLYAAVVAHDYERNAMMLLRERKQAALPPFQYQALLRAEASALADALNFLKQASMCIEHPGVTMNDPIPMTITRVANIERAQLLVESASRPTMQEFLKRWNAALRGIKSRAKWTLEVDPIDI